MTLCRQSSSDVAVSLDLARIAAGSDPNGDSGNAELNRMIADSGSSCCVERGVHRIRQFDRRVHSDKLVDGTVVASGAYLAEEADRTRAVACYCVVPSPAAVQPRTDRAEAEAEDSTVGRLGGAVE